MKFRIADFQINIARGWLSRLVWGTNVQFVSANHMLDTDRREPRCSFEPISVEPQVLDRLIYPVPRSRRQQGRAHCFSLGRLEYLQSRRPSIIGLPTRLISTWGHFRLADCVHLDRQSLAPSEARVCCPAVCDGRRLWPGAVSGFLSTRDKKSCPITSSPTSQRIRPVRRRSPSDGRLSGCRYAGGAQSRDKSLEERIVIAEEEVLARQFAGVIRLSPQKFGRGEFGFGTLADAAERGR